MNRGIWDREMVAVLLIAAFLPLMILWVRYEGTQAVTHYLFVLLVLAGWQLVFMLARAQPPSLSAIFTALAIAMLAPEELGFIRLFAGISFGIVMGELVFGGWGRNVVNPATVALAFLGFGFPSFPWPDMLLPVAWAAIPAFLIGVAAGIFSAAVVLGAVAVVGCGILAGGLGEPVLTASAIILFLLVSDPVTSAATGLGRWLYGAFYGALILLFAYGWAGADAVQIAVAAALLASIAAPLLDEIAIAIWLMRRRRRHGRP